MERAMAQTVDGAHSVSKMIDMSDSSNKVCRRKRKQHYAFLTSTSSTLFGIDADSTTCHLLPILEGSIDFHEVGYNWLCECNNANGDDDEDHGNDLHDLHYDDKYIHYGRTFI